MINTFKTIINVGFIILIAIGLVFFAGFIKSLKGDQNGKNNKWQEQANHQPPNQYNNPYQPDYPNQNTHPNQVTYPNQNTHPNQVRYPNQNSNHPSQGQYRSGNVGKPLTLDITFPSGAAYHYDWQSYTQKSMTVQNKSAAPIVIFINGKKVQHLSSLTTPSAVFKIEVRNSDILISAKPKRHRFQKVDLVSR